MAWLAIGRKLLEEKRVYCDCAEKRWLFGIYLEVDSNAININAPDKLR